jgi:hypothetical protein
MRSNGASKGASTASVGLRRALTLIAMLVDRFASGRAAFRAPWRSCWLRVHCVCRRGMSDERLEVVKIAATFA